MIHPALFLLGFILTAHSIRTALHETKTYKTQTQPYYNLFLIFVTKQSLLCKIYTSTLLRKADCINTHFVLQFLFPISVLRTFFWITNAASPFPYFSLRLPRSPQKSVLSATLFFISIILLRYTATNGRLRIFLAFILLFLQLHQRTILCCRCESKIILFMKHSAVGLHTAFYLLFIQLNSSQQLSPTELFLNFASFPSFFLSLLTPLQFAVARF